MKTLTILLLSIMSTQAFACFNGREYGHNWSQSETYWMIAFLLWLISMFSRVIRCNSNFKLPFSILVLCSLIPSYAIYDFGNGDCGWELTEVSIYPTYIMFSLAIYELYMLWAFKKYKAPNKSLKQDK